MTSQPVRKEPRTLSSNANRRATVRYRCAPATPGKVYVDEDHEFQRAWILDISHTGVGLLMQRPIGESSMMIIAIKGEKAVHHLTAQVARVTQTPQGEWTIGCELVMSLSDDDLDDLLG